MLGGGRDAADEVGDLFLRPLHLDDEQRLHVERVAGMGEGLADLDRRPVHVFDRNRDDPRADDRRDARARILGGTEAHQHRAGAFRGAEDTHGRFGDDAKLAFRAYDQAEEIVAGTVELPANVDDGAIDQHHADGEHVVGGDAIFQAMGATGVHRDVAGDCAGELARWVGSVEEPSWPTALVMLMLVTPASTRAVRSA